jgi:hypothetical protein
MKLLFVRLFASFAGKQAHEKECSWRALPSKPPCWQFASGIMDVASVALLPAGGKHGSRRGMRKSAAQHGIDYIPAHNPRKKC